MCLANWDVTFKPSNFINLYVGSAQALFCFKLLEGPVHDTTWGWNFGGTNLIGCGQETELPSQRPSTLKKKFWKEVECTSETS
jgi:hypothetical protein